MTFQQIRDIANDHLYSQVTLEMKKEFNDLDIYGIIEDNLGYFQEHRVTPKDFETCRSIRNKMDMAQRLRSSRYPMAGDRITLTATGSKTGETRTYIHALVVSADYDTVCICTQPYVPFIFFGDYELPRLDVSGGYFQKHPMKELEFEFRTTGLFQFWGRNIMRANGTITMDLPCYRWTLTSDQFY
jgi:hypothetical protein